METKITILIVIMLITISLIVVNFLKLKAMAKLIVINNAKENTYFVLPTPKILNTDYNSHGSGSIVPFRMSDFISKSDWDRNNITRVELVRNSSQAPSIYINGTKIISGTLSISHRDTVGFEMDGIVGDRSGLYIVKAYNSNGESNEVEVQVNFRDTYVQPTGFVLPSPVNLSTRYDGSRNTEILPFYMYDIISQDNWEDNNITRVDLLRVGSVSGNQGPQSIYVHDVEHNSPGTISTSYEDSVGFKMENKSGDLKSQFILKAFNSNGESNEIVVNVSFEDTNVPPQEDPLVITSKFSAFQYENGKTFNKRIFLKDLVKPLETQTSHIEITKILESPYKLMFTNGADEDIVMQQGVKYIYDEIGFNVNADDKPLYITTSGNPVTTHGDRTITFKYRLYDNRTDRYSNEATYTINLTEKIKELELEVTANSPWINGAELPFHVSVRNEGEVDEERECPLLTYEVLGGYPATFRAESTGTKGEVNVIMSGTEAGIRKVKTTITTCDNRTKSSINYFQLGIGNCESRLENIYDEPNCINKPGTGSINIPSPKDTNKSEISILELTKGTNVDYSNAKFVLTQNVPNYPRAYLAYYDENGTEHILNVGDDFYLTDLAGEDFNDKKIGLFAVDDASVEDVMTFKYKIRVGSKQSNEVTFNIHKTEDAVPRLPNEIDRAMIVNPGFGGGVYQTRQPVSIDELIDNVKDRNKLKAIEVKAVSDNSLVVDGQEVEFGQTYPIGEGKQIILKIRGTLEKSWIRFVGLTKSGSQETNVCKVNIEKVVG